MAIRVLDFESTLKCTHDCMYCYNAWKKTRLMPDDLDTQETKQMLQKAIAEMNPKRFIFSGGEPFIRSDWCDLVAFVHSFKLPITMISNGALLDEDDFVFCKKKRCRYFRIYVAFSRKIYS